MCARSHGSPVEEEEFNKKKNWEVSTVLLSNQGTWRNHRFPNQQMRIGLGVQFTKQHYIQLFIC